MKKKKAILVTTRFPWPLTNGFATKNFWLIRGLSDEYDIDLHVIQRQMVSERDLAFITPYCKSIKVYKPSFFDLLFGVFQSLIWDLPLQIALYKSSQAAKAIKNGLQSSEVAICSVIRGAQYFAQFDHPVLYDLADSLGQVYARDANKFHGIKRLVYQEEGRRMRKYERATILSRGRTVFFNQQEVDAYSISEVSAVPHGVDPALFEVSGSDLRCSDGVVIFGKMNFEPNVHAVYWFVENVLHLLPKSINLYVIGISPSSSILKLASKNSRIKVLGYIENPYPLIRGAIASVCPIQIGGGIQNKVIESLSIGSLTIISPLAAIPMSDLESSGLIVCDSPQEWAQMIIAVASNPHEYENRRLKGPPYARTHFSWQSYASAIKSQIKLMQNSN